MIPPLNFEYPKLVGDTMYRIAGGTIVEEDISLTKSDIDKLREELGVTNE